MKKIFTATYSLLLGISTLFAQNAVKPTIMVVPDASWCKNNGYVREDGSVDYAKALTNEDLKGTIIVMNDFMAEVGYPMESLEQKLADLDTEAAIDIVGVSRNDADIKEDDLDKLLRNANADIMVKLGITNEPYGPRRILQYHLESVDAASGKTIGGGIGTSSVSNAPASSLVKESVSSFMDNFLHKIDIFFADMSNKGREGSIIFKIAEDCPVNMEDIIYIPGAGEGELRDYLEYWLQEHTVDGAPRANGSSRVRAAYNQVRFPLYGFKTSGFGAGKAKPITAESFIKDIIPDLRGVGISARVIPMGVGKATVILGGM